MTKTRPKKRRKEYKTRRAILDILKHEGPQESKVLSKRLEMTAMGIRQHLYSLEDEKFVTFTEEHRPMGRPAKLWELTPSASQFFPDGSSALLVDILGCIENTYGPEALPLLIQTRKNQQLQQYQEKIKDCQGLESKLKNIAKIRTEEGYMAEIQKQENGGGYLLIENHCPICEAAWTCQNFCSAELTLFQDLLGPGVHIQRSDHILSGERRCVYEVHPS